MADQGTQHADAEAGVGSRELTRTASAWLACLAFVVTFAVAELAGARTFTAFVRGGIAAFATRIAAAWLLMPAVSAVIAAMARDRAVTAAQAAAEAKDGEAREGDA